MTSTEERLHEPFDTIQPPPPVDPPADEGGDRPERRGLGISRVVALCAVFALLGFGISQFLDRPRHPGAASADVGFLQDMMLHHEQAIEMALYELYLGQDNEVRQTAVDIVLSQRGEYMLMADRLTAWGHELPDPDGTAMAWMGHATPARSMPGLATAAQIAKLRASKGRDADLLFMELMMVHHQAGVEMARVAADQAGNAWVRDLASRMVRAQASEITEMRLMAKRLGKDLPVPGPMMDGSKSRSSEPSGDHGHDGS